MWTKKNRGLKTEKNLGGKRVKKKSRTKTVRGNFNSGGCILPADHNTMGQNTEKKKRGPKGQKWRQSSKSRVLTGKSRVKGGGPGQCAIWDNRGGSGLKKGGSNETRGGERSHSAGTTSSQN